MPWGAGLRRILLGWWQSYRVSTWLTEQACRRRLWLVFLLHLGLLWNWLLALRVQVQDLMADVLQKLHRDVLYKLLPPTARRLFGCPLLDIKLTQATSQVHDCDGYDLWLPLKRKHGAEAIIHKRPGHLHQLLHLIFVTFQLFGITKKKLIRMLHLQIKLDCLEQYPLQHHNFFLRIIAKLGKLHVIQQAASCFDDVFTLLWSLLNLSSQK